MCATGPRELAGGSASALRAGAPRLCFVPYPMSLHLSKSKIAAGWVLIALVGVVAGGFGYRSEESRKTAELIDAAKRCAVVFDGPELRKLAGARADGQSPLYAAMKRRLIDLQAVNPRVRFVYVFRSRPETGQVSYLGDSAKPGAKDESLPGDDFPQAAESPGLQAILRTGMAATEGPLQDDFGVWITGYAPIDSAPAGKPGESSRQIVGMDIDAADWSRGLWSAAFQRAFYLWMLLGIPFGALLVMRRQLEQREAIRNLSEAMEQSHSALLVVDLDSCIEYANRGLCRQMGYSRRELIGHKWRDFQVDETPSEILAEMVSTVRAGRAWEGEWSNRRKDGAVYPVRGVVTPVKHRDGSISCYVAVFDDITDFKRKEAELREARDQAQTGDRAKGQFLATMSHEVRTPLNGIVGFTNLLLDTPLTAEQREFVHTIRTGGEALIQLTGDILDYARIESGKLALEPAPCDPRECVEEALDLFATVATAKKIEMLHWIDDDVPAAVLVDGGRLRQVLMNLVNNAVKFTDRGEVEVTVTLAPEPTARPVDTPGATALAAVSDTVVLKFSVRDTGIGIAPDQSEKLFKPFSQIDGTSTRKFGGTGLGLAICRNIMQRLNGEVSFTSEPGHGCVFSFSLRVPVIVPAQPAPGLPGRRLALVARPGSMRRELACLARRWRVKLTEVDDAAELREGEWDNALVEVDDALARVLTAPNARPLGLPPEKTFGLVSLSLSTERRQALHAHFCLLLNKPVHQAALFGLLSETRKPAPAAPAPAPHHALQVLLVEDNAVNQRLMGKVLTNLGCKWSMAENGRRAFEELSRDGAAYDVVLMDLHMPELDGLAAITEIRSGKAGPAAKTVWIATLTADARDDQRERARVAGANDYLTKPLKLTDLEGALQRFRTGRKNADKSQSNSE